MSKLSFVSPTGHNFLNGRASIRSSYRLCPQCQLTFNLATTLKRPRSEPNLVYAIEEQKDYIQPGTTALLLRLEKTDVKSVRFWLKEWIQEFLFKAEGTLSTPISTDTDGKSSFLFFYASPGSIRGVLTFTANTESVGSSVLVRITSSSRFINPSGTFSATLPGERRIIRKFFSSIQQDYQAYVRVLYKPPYIRLRKNVQTNIPENGHSVKRQHVTLLVGEIRDAPTESHVVNYVHQWATELQFGAGIGMNVGVFRRARIPPLSTQAMENGIRMKVGTARGGTRDSHLLTTNAPEILILTKEKSNRMNIFRNDFRKRIQQDSKEESPVPKRPIQTEKVIILGSTTHPYHEGTRAILSSLSAGIQHRFPSSQLHLNKYNI